MISDHSHRITDIFAAGSRDLTPAPARHAAYVLYMPVLRDPENRGIVHRSSLIESC